MTRYGEASHDAMRYDYCVLPYYYDNYHDNNHKYDINYYIILIITIT